MTELSQLILAIIGAIIIWTSSIITGMIWLTNKFRNLEAAIYRESERNRKMFEAQLYAHSTRIQRLELRTFGFTATNSGVTEPDDGQTFP